MADKWIVYCLTIGTSTPFPVEAYPYETVGQLKEAIKKRKPNAFGHIDADELTLYHVNIPDDNNLKENVKRQLETKRALEGLKATFELSEYFEAGPLKKTIHILVQLPSAVSAAEEKETAKAVDTEATPATAEASVAAETKPEEKTEDAEDPKLKSVGLFSKIFGEGNKKEKLEKTKKKEKEKKVKAPKSPKKPKSPNKMEKKEEVAPVAEPAAAPATNEAAPTAAGPVKETAAVGTSAAATKDAKKKEKVGRRLSTRITSLFSAKKYVPITNSLADAPVATSAAAGTSAAATKDAKKKEKVGRRLSTRITSLFFAKKTTTEPAPFSYPATHGPKPYNHTGH